MKFDVKKVYNIVALAGCGVVLLAMFLPYVSALGYSKSLVEGDGIFVIIALVPALVGIFIQKKILYSIFAGIITIICFIEVIQMSSVSEKTYGLASKGAGYYLFILGVLALIAGAVLWFVMGSKEEGPAEPMGGPMDGGPMGPMDH